MSAISFTSSDKANKNKNKTKRKEKLFPIHYDTSLLKNSEYLMTLVEF